jgi:molybdate transport system substrate-binding protein
MKAAGSLIVLLLYLLFSCSGSQTKEAEVTVFCASSLTPVVEQLKLQWEKEHDEKIMISSASSGTLARQIENGAQADVFLSANEDWMDYLISTMQLESSSEKIASNRLVVVAPSKSILQCNNIQDLFGLISGIENMIAIGDPAHVPLGKYTREVMEHHRMLLNNSSNLVLTKDARSALRLVELEEVDLGIVYRSDAIASTRVKTVFTIPEKYHTEISYQAILLNKENTGAKRFMSYLTSDENRTIWRENAFED